MRDVEMDSSSVDGEAETAPAVASDATPLVGPIDRLLDALVVGMEPPPGALLEAIHAHAEREAELARLRAELRAANERADGLARALYGLLVGIEGTSLSSYCEMCEQRAPQSAVGQAIAPVAHKRNCPLELAADAMWPSGGAAARQPAPPAAAGQPVERAPAPSAPETPGVWRCESCGEPVSVADLDVVGGHLRALRDGRGFPIEAHCGPVTQVPADIHDHRLEAHVQPDARPGSDALDMHAAEGEGRR